MNAAYAADLLKLLMTNAVALASPILLTAMAIGLAVSLFQSVTSIQEQTLTFVPKALAIVALVFSILSFCIIGGVGAFLWTSPDYQTSMGVLGKSLGDLFQAIIQFIKAWLKIP